MPNLTEQQTAELIASHEIALEKLATREQSLTEQFQASEEFLNEQLAKINALMTDLQEMMSETGAARLRLSAQEAMKLGHQQLQQLQQLSQTMADNLKENVQHFTHSTENMIKQLHSANAMINPDAIKEFFDQQHTHIQHTGSNILICIKSSLRWFQWKNICMSVGIALLTAIAIGLYMNDEWPWEMHQAIIKQRAAGKALISAWPQLSPQDQAYLKSKSVTAIL